MEYLCLGVHCLLHFAEVLLQLIEGVFRLLRILDEEQVLLFQRLSCMDDGGQRHSESEGEDALTHDSSHPIDW